MERRFLRCSLREALLLTAVLAVLLAILAPRMKGASSQRRIESQNRRLFAAAKAGDLDEARAAIAAGAEVDAYDQHLGTVLGVAAKRRDLRLVQLLLDEGANPDSAVGPSARGGGLLQYAVTNNDVPLARQALRAGAKWPIGTQLQRAAQSGYEEMLELLLTHEKAQARQCIENPLPPEEALLYAPPRPWQETLDATLFWAFSAPSDVKLRMVRRLLERGAQLGDRKHPSTAMDHVVRNGNAELADLLCEFGAEYTPREAVAFNRFDEVKRMVTEDPAILQQRFPAFYAAELPPTLLGLALRRGHREMAMLLIDSGAPLTEPQWFGGTLMHEAASGGDPELIKLLAARGLDVNGPDENGLTPLHYAGSRESTAEAVAALIELGAEVNVGTWTPLHVAVSAGDVRKVQLLLSAGADTTTRDGHGRTPLGMSQENGKGELWDLLNAATTPKGS